MTEEIEEMGPIDWLLVEWPDRQPTGEAMPYLIDLVESGLIRILDLAFVVKRDDGSVAELEIADVDGASDTFAVFAGASSGILDQSDFDDAGAALEPGRAAALLVYENRWAGPFASALRRTGAQLVASGRIPVQALLASLDATEK